MFKLERMYVLELLQEILATLFLKSIDIFFRFLRLNSLRQLSKIN